MSWSSYIGDLGAVATAAGVAVGVWQLRAGRREAQSAFEDSLTREYRGIAALLPVSAFLDMQFDRKQVIVNLDQFHRYIDLCNEQTFLHEQGRISPQTWTQWRDGITSNLDRDGFRLAWSVIAALAADDFDELRRIVEPSTLSDDERQAFVTEIAEGQQAR